MTTVIQTREPLQILSMSNQERRKSKRLAALYDEQDGDFKFLRASKRPRTTDLVEDDPPQPAPETQARKPGRGRPSKEKAHRLAAVEEPAAEVVTSKRRSTRRKPSLDTFDEPPPLAVPKKQTKKKGTRHAAMEEGGGRARQNGAPVEDDDRMDIIGGTPVHLVPSIEDSEDVQKVALPMSDTPVINRNKEMRKKAGTGSRRSSLGSRGRRASSLIDMGHTALPHKEVSASEFYKHIESEGLPEPRRMKQLLTWCGERSLSEKPPLGSRNSGAILGARAIQDQLLKDFQSKSQFSNWFDREDAPVVEAIKQPNPRNIEHALKIEQLEERIKRLREQKKMWLSLKKVGPDLEPLFQDTEDASQLPPPDESLLDPNEARMLQALAGNNSSFENLQAQTTSCMQAAQAKLQFRIDVLADSVHKLERRVATAGREADQVLERSAARLKERDEREKRAAGTRDLPIMEVIRSLSRILPPEDR